MTKLTGDELIEVGFRRLIEEMQELRGALTEIRSALDNITSSCTQTASASRATASKADMIEQHVFTAVGNGVDINNKLDRIKADTLTLAVNMCRVEQTLIRKDDADGTDGSEDV